MNSESGSSTLVTGGSGFIGTNLIACLRSLGGEVVNLDISPPRNREHADLWIRTDLTDHAAVATLVSARRPRQVVHLGARTDLGGDSLEDYRANTDGTRNLLAALASLDEPPPVLVASTRMVCTIGYQPTSDDDYAPPNAYGESKVETERIVRGSGYPGRWAIFRPTSIWGPWFDVPYRDFFLRVARGRYWHPSGARILKSFGYVENTVEQILGLMRAPGDTIHGRLFYLADYEPIEVSDWAERIRRATGGSPVRTIPVGALRAAAGIFDILQKVGWKNVPLTRFRLLNLMTEMLYDLEPIRGVVPELPVSLDTGVERTVEWLRWSGALNVDSSSP